MENKIAEISDDGKTARLKDIDYSLDELLTIVEHMKLKQSNLKYKRYFDAIESAESKGYELEDCKSCYKTIGYAKPGDTYVTYFDEDFCECGRYR